MTKIVVTNHQSFTAEQKKRLNSLGNVTYYDSIPETAEDYLDRVKGADIICSGTAGLKIAYSQLKDVYVTVAFVSVAFVDLGLLRKNNVTISNAPGSNRHAVSEWVTYMMLTMLRQFNIVLNTNESPKGSDGLPPMTEGLCGKKIVVLGKGNIGKRVGKIADSLDMEVDYFKRGDDLYSKVKNADIVVDTLSSNPTTQKLLGDKFFQAIKKGSYFITVSRSELVDENAMFKALDSGHLAGAASDASGALVGDIEDTYYQKLLKHPRVYVTPHIAYNSNMSSKMGLDIMIDNVEAFIEGRPQNVLN